MLGATLPAGMNWRGARDLLEGQGSSEEKASQAVYNYLSEGNIDETRRSDLKYSDQTAYFNQAVQSQNRPSTVGHESTHRGIWKMADEVWEPGYLDLKTNKLLTRVMDYKYGNAASREKAIPWIQSLSPDKTLEGGLRYAEPLIEELTAAAINANKTP